MLCHEALRLGPFSASGIFYAAKLVLLTFVVSLPWTRFVVGSLVIRLFPGGQGLPRILGEFGDCVFRMRAALESVVACGVSCGVSALFGLQTSMYER